MKGEIDFNCFKALKNFVYVSVTIKNKIKETT